MNKEGNKEKYYFSKTKKKIYIYIYIISKGEQIF